MGLFGVSMEERLRRDLIGYWSMNQPAGAVEKNRFPQRSGALDMAPSGTVGSAAGPSAEVPLARSFGGGANFLTSTNDSVYFPTGAHATFTAAGWIYLSSKASTRTLISHNLATGNQRGWTLDYESVNDRFRLVVFEDGGTSISSVALDTGLGSPSLDTWYFLFGRFGRDRRARIRVNMLAEAQGNAITGVFNSTSPMRIGSDGSVGHVGRAAAIGLWGAHLPDAAGEYLYNRGRGRILKGLR